MHVRFAPVLFLTLAGWACSNTLQPFEPEIRSVNDSFEFQITDTRNLTTTRDYTWNNTMPTATVDQSSSVASGSATVEIFDSQGVKVYARNLAEDGTFQTSTGASGTWRIRVIFQQLNATINFRAQALTP